MLNKSNKCKEKAKIGIKRRAFTVEIEEDQNAIECRNPFTNHNLYENISANGSENLTESPCFFLLLTSAFARNFMLVRIQNLKSTVIRVVLGLQLTSWVSVQFTRL